MEERYPLDEVTLVCAARAAGFAKPISYTMRILELTFTELGSKSALAVAHTALTNLKYFKANGINVQHVSPKSILRIATEIHSWICDRGITPDAKTMVNINLYFKYALPISTWYFNLI